jgi:hypothetical protein
MNRKTRMTRKELAEYLRQEGIPLSDSTLNKLCMSTVNEGPPVEAWWGRRPLYDPGKALVWAEGRMRQARLGDVQAETRTAKATSEASDG